jgi:hypothetical protein
MFAEFAKPGASIAGKQRLIEGEYAYIVWTSETADNSYELASDTLCYSERKHSIASFHGEGQTEALIQETPINLQIH